MREYERNVAETVWICLDTRGEGGDLAEAAVEMAATLAARTFQAGKRFAFVGGGFTVEPGYGSAHLESVLDALARVEFRTGDGPVRPPVSPHQCILVTPSHRSPGTFAQVISAGGSPSGAGAQRHSGGSRNGPWDGAERGNTGPGVWRTTSSHGSEEEAGR